jgi:hypothetical protein
MNAGLIPLVSRAAGVDMGDFGGWIEPVTIESIRDCVSRAASTAPDELARRSRRAQETARTLYAPEAFGRNFQESFEAAVALPAYGEGYSSEARR